MANDTSSKNETFWRSQLSGYSVARFSPIKPSQGNSQADATLSLTVDLSQDLCSAVSLSIRVRAAWAILLARYSNCDDVVFGVFAEDKRTTGGNDEKPNLPSKVLPARVILDQEQQVRDFLKQIQRQATEMDCFDDSLDNIKGYGTEMAAACDFQSILVLNDCITDTDDEGTLLNCPLVIKSMPARTGLEVQARYSGDVISPQQMRRILCQFAQLIRQINDKKIGVILNKVDMLSPEDREQINQWNSTMPGPTWDLVHNVITRQVKLSPTAQAICSWDGEFTYEELDDMSTQLGSYLVERGVGPETFVPLCFEKSAWTVVAMLAVMKAGGAFVPLDINHPVDRLLEIVRQVNAEVILVSSDAVNLGLGPAESLIELSASTYAWLPEADTVTSAVQPNNVVYTIFTSGSTGTPKGVVIEHGAFCAGVKPRGEVLLRNNESRVLQFASYSFDTSLEDILTTLMYGGCICVPSEEERMNDIPGAIARLNANTAHLTPSFINVLSPEIVPTLKFLRLGGERMSAAHIEIWGSAVELRNVYGPTECCITATSTGRVMPDFDAACIGKGVAASTWIVDSLNHDRLMPIGMSGELLVEGPILARGYLNDEQKTASSFITDPLWTRGQEASKSPRRFYKTGDLARYDSDGNILYIGRKDTQVKLRGQRIELGEVENNLRRVLPGAVELAVELITLSNEYVASLLVAFICLGDAFEGGEESLENMSPTTRDLLKQKVDGVPARLARSLPSHMIPTVYVPLKSMPRTSAKKADRRELRRLVSGLTMVQLKGFSVK